MPLVRSDERVRDEVGTRLENDRAAAIPEQVHRLGGQPLARYRRLALWMAVTDAACILVALVAGYAIRFQALPFQGSYLLLLLVAPLLWVPVFRAFQLYAPQRLSALEEFRGLISATSVTVLLISVLSFWSYSSFSRIVVALTWTLALAFELATRWLWRGYIARRRADGTLRLRTLVVGGNGNAAKVAENLKQSELALEPVGFVGATDLALGSDDLPLLGLVGSLERIVTDQDIDCFFISPTGLAAGDVIAAVSTARRMGLELHVASGVPELLSSRLSLHAVGDSMAISIRMPSLTGYQLIAKRAFDLIAAGVGLILFSPVLVGVAIAVKLTSPGPVVFTQERVTKGGRTFRMLKFRTMRHDADQMLEEMQVDKTAAFFKLGGDDPRLTRLGAILRRLSLDELPQLINVLRGEMSLVGPRPLPKEQISANLHLLEARHEVPAGMTGWWQVQGRSTIETPEKAVELDQFYIENWSLALDVYIVLKTFGVVLARRGAH